MKRLLIILILALLLASCGGSSTPSIEDRVRVLNFTTGTPQGVAIYAETGVSISPAMLAAIDTGLQRTFTKTKCKYNRSLSYGNYQFAVIRGELYNGNPVYRLPCGQYCGTEYDKGGFIYAAGQVIDFVPQDSGRRNVIVIPEQFANIANAETISEYEAEHVELAHWDADLAAVDTIELAPLSGSLFESTKTHSGGAGHPIIPNCP